MQPATLVTAGLNFSYEADLFGRLSRASEAAREDANAREALLQSTRLMVQADVAQTYLQLRSLQTERQLVEQSLAAYRETLTLIEKRFRAGDAAELDVARMQTEVSATEAETLALERQQAALTHALAVLVGDVATGFTLAAQPVLATLPVIPAGVPATVLARRPDVSAAQASVLAAQARVGVAQAAWFPAITLTGNGGYASPELGDLFKWSARSWGIGALLSLPIFDGGQRAAQEEGARARLEAAVAAQRGQVLAAFREVEDQLSALRLLSGQARVLGQAVQSSERATHLSDVRYRNGLVSQLELLDARRNELRNRRQALQVRTAQYTATVALIVRWAEAGTAESPWRQAAEASCPSALAAGLPAGDSCCTASRCLQRPDRLSGLMGIKARLEALAAQAPVVLDSLTVHVDRQWMLHEHHFSRCGAVGHGVLLSGRGAWLPLSDRLRHGPGRPRG
jgi:multidrug efflux system outer membrane protein